MPVATTNLILYQAAVMPLSAATTGVGGAKSSTPITGAGLSEVFFAFASYSSGGGDNVQHAKVCASNDHGSLSAYGVKFFLLNALTAWGSTNYVNVAFDTAPTDLKARIVGFESGTEFAEEFTVNSTSTNSSEQTDDLKRIEFRNGTSGDLEGVAGSATIKNGSTTIGICPGPINTESGTIPGRYSATAEVDIGLEPSGLDDSVVLPSPTTPVTPPTGVTFSRPRTLATGLSVGSGGTIAAGSYQSIWERLTAYERVLTSGDVQSVLAMAALATT